MPSTTDQPDPEELTAEGYPAAEAVEQERLATPKRGVSTPGVPEYRDGVVRPPITGGVVAEWRQNRYYHLTFECENCGSTDWWLLYPIPEEAAYLFGCRKCGHDTPMGYDVVYDHLVTSDRYVIPDRPDRLPE